MEYHLLFLLILQYCSAHDVIVDDPFPMHTAAGKGNLNMIVHLVQGGADINQQNVGWKYTPLHSAAYYGRSEIVQYLLSKGASKTIGAYEGDTALDVTRFRECDTNSANDLCKEASWNYVTTIRILRADCVSNIWCRSDRSCVNQKCVNPCSGYCGANTNCRAKSHQPICTCKEGYSGLAETGCQRLETTTRFGCTSDANCPQHQICMNRNCKDACSKDTCSENEICSITSLGGFKAFSCKCPNGFFVDTDNNCKKSGCINHSECGDNKLCNLGKCNNPCDTAKCGQGAGCRVVQRRQECFCPDNTVGNPIVLCQTKPECFGNSECGNDKRCESGNCVNPCDRVTCGQGARCRVQRRYPQCFCPALTQGDPLVQCQTISGPVTNRRATMCQVPSDTDTNVTIIKCGTGAISNCVINQNVPVDTDVMVSCWQSSSFIAKCTNRTTWDICNDNSCETPRTRLVHLCQQEAPNAQYCGYRPPFIPSRFTTVQQWPWLVGIFVFEKYVCTGTLISVRYVLTAAHCTAQSKSSNQPVDKHDVKLQHFVGNGIIKSRIEKIIHHPKFQNSVRPVNDISLIRLQNAVIFSKTVMPACLAVQQPTQAESSVAFDRNEGESNFKWRELLRTNDNRCQISGGRNPCQLQIQERQFCSKPHFLDFSSVIKQGASGGPYLVNTGNEEQEQQSVVGVASYRVQTSCQDPFTVYTDVTGFSRWIQYCLDTPLNATKDCHGYTGF